MVLIYFLIFDKELSDVLFRELLSKFPKKTRYQILACGAKQQQYSKLAGRLLLQKLLHDLKQNCCLDQLQYTSRGKPFFHGHFNFNISHSGNMVACAAKLNGPIGLDVEKIVSINLDDLSNYFSTPELAEINAHPDQQALILETWVKKEALLKASGTGVSLQLKNINTIADTVEFCEQIYFFHKLAMHPDYKAWLVTNESTDIITIKEISIFQL